MIIRHATRGQIQQALDQTNKDYEGNLQFNRLDPNGKGFNMTLRVADSHGKGARLGFQSLSTGKQRHLINACWHAHGDFFDNLIAIEPDAVIMVSGGITINRNGGNWQDRNIGSMDSPMYFSEACDC